MPVNRRSDQASLGRIAAGSAASAAIGGGHGAPIQSRSMADLTTTNRDRATLTADRPRLACAPVITTAQHAARPCGPRRFHMLVHVRDRRPARARLWSLQRDVDDVFRRAFGSIDRPALPPRRRSRSCPTPTASPFAPSSRASIRPPSPSASRAATSDDLGRAQRREARERRLSAARARLRHVLADAPPVRRSRCRGHQRRGEARRADASASPSAPKPSRARSRSRSADTADGAAHAVRHEGELTP